MTTTDIFQKTPDFFNNKEECMKNTKSHIVINNRYPNFTQTHYTAGDEEQFETYRVTTNCSDIIPNIPDNKFIMNRKWSKLYKDLESVDVIRTFKYIFHKFKKGVYVSIRNNLLKVFLPFSKANFINEWSHLIKYDSNKYKNILELFESITTNEGYKFNPKKVNRNIQEWYCNNGLVRYEYPISEGDSNIGNLKNMLEELCAAKEVPDIDFFLNRRDYPLLKNDSTEPYYNIWGDNVPLVSHNYSRYIPILSMSGNTNFADVLIPTCDDWARVQSSCNIWFPKNCREYDTVFDIDWSDKIDIAVFRGSSTGEGVTIEDNQRLHISYLSHIQTKKNIDAGITEWNLRPRKSINGNLETIDIKDLPFGLVNKLSPKEQSKYKYIINIEGHVAAFRLSYELSYGSVILLVDSKWKIWYSDYLEPFVHYVPVNKDLSDIHEKIEWCRNNDEKCKIIANNALQFYKTYLCKDSILQYLQKTLCELKKYTGTYIYPKYTLHRYIRNYEYKHLYMDVKYGNNIPLGNMIFDNNNSSIYKCKIDGKDYICKIGSKDKTDEYIHEFFVANKCINNMKNYIPNFREIHGIRSYEKKYQLVCEYIDGITLQEYIISSSFNFDTYIKILLQLCLTINMSQYLYGFIHNDLTPWNIMLVKTENESRYDYVVEEQIYSIHSDIIPIIIDYGKSHIIYERKHYGIINIFDKSFGRDIMTILMTSMLQIVKNKYLEKREYSNLLYLSNYFHISGISPVSFRNAKCIRDFLKTQTKFSALLNNNTKCFRSNLPLKILKYICKTPNTIYNRIVKKVSNFKYYKQLSITVKDETIYIPSSDILLYAYYISQRLEPVIKSTDIYMYHDMINKAVKYPTFIQKYCKEYTYTEDIFYSPSELNSMYNMVKAQSKCDDLGELSMIYTLVINNKGVFRVKDEHHGYMENLNKMISGYNINQKFNIANIETFKYLYKKFIVL